MERTSRMGKTENLGVGKADHEPELVILDSLDW